MIIREYSSSDLEMMTEIWNNVVEEGNSFPQTEKLSTDEAAGFFAGQSRTGVAEEDGCIIGMYILHPNNVGRCGHIANASYAVKPGMRGRHTGEALVKDSISAGRALGFRILQFNAVVATNTAAINLYKKLGFTRLGRIPGGFRTDNSGYSDIFLYYIKL